MDPILITPQTGPEPASGPQLSRQKPHLVSCAGKLQSHLEESACGITTPLSVGHMSRSLVHDLLHRTHASHLVSMGAVCNIVQLKFLHSA